MAKVECFFDISSPWTYLAFHNLEALAAELGFAVTWRPILVGGVFNAVNPTIYAQRANPVPVKDAYMTKDLGDWARLAGLAIRWRPSVFPVNSVKVMRGCIVAEPLGLLPALSRAAFEAYWGDDRDISQDAVLAEVCDRAGLDRSLFFDGIARPEVKDALRTNTDELMARGGFGSPTIFVGGDDMYFGNDRLPLVRAALARGG